MREGDLMRMIGPDGEDLGVALLGPQLPSPASPLLEFVRALERAGLAAQRFGDAFAVFCDGEAAAELWCRHHPSPMGEDYSHRLGHEYRRRRKARGRRGRR